MRRGFTLIELMISIVLLGVIMAAISSIFVVALKNYQTQTQKSGLQKELNFAMDDIGKQMKLASKGMNTYDTYNRIQNPDNLLILELPAEDTDGDFIYSGSILEGDYFVYYVSNGSLFRKTYTNLSGRRSDQDGQTLNIISGVQSFTCEYLPNPNPTQIKCDLSIARTVNGRSISLSAQKISNLRNAQ